MLKEKCRVKPLEIYFRKNFPFSVDLFRLPFFSQDEYYISAELKKEIESNHILGLKFSNSPKLIFEHE